MVWLAQKVVHYICPKMFYRTKRSSLFFSTASVTNEMILGNWQQRCNLLFSPTLHSGNVLGQHCAKTAFTYKNINYGRNASMDSKF